MADLDQRNNPYNVTQASRIYFLPNLMTAGNLFCGFAAVIKCIQARLLTDAGDYTLAHPNLSWMTLYTHAVWLILAAVVFDSLDGRLARMGELSQYFPALIGCQYLFQQGGDAGIDGRCAWIRRLKAEGEGDPDVGATVVGDARPLPGHPSTFAISAAGMLFASRINAVILDR